MSKKGTISISSKAAPSTTSISTTSEASEMGLTHITEALVLLTLEDVRKLTCIVMAELRRRKAASHSSDTPKVAADAAPAKAAHHSADHMAAMRAAKAAKRTSTIASPRDGKRGYASATNNAHRFCKGSCEGRVLSPQGGVCSEDDRDQVHCHAEDLKRKFEDAKAAAEVVRELVAQMRREYVIVSLLPASA